MIKFIFDLDGTVTKKETLPIIAQHFCICESIDTLTQDTIAGNIPFVESFIQRVHILGAFPAEEINTLLGDVELSHQVCDFIKTHQEQCAIATGNLHCWIEKLVQKIGCPCFCSESILTKKNVHKLTKILKKEEIVNKYQSIGYKVVFIGDGNNDAEAMRRADISIAAGLVHYPAQSVLSIADYAVFSEEALCRLLRQLC